MRFLKQILAIVSLTLLAGAAVGQTAVSATNPREGIEFKTMPQPQPTDSGKKVEVVEFFGYFCPHCYALDPALSEWAKKQGDRIDFKRVHVLFDPRMLPVQQAYITLELMGKTEVAHKKIFEALHLKRMRLDTEPAMTEFLVKEAGIDRAKYLEIYNSFSTQTRLRRAAKQLQDYAIDTVPQVFVDGRFMSAPDLMRAKLGSRASEADLANALMQTLDVLVERVIKERAAGKK